MEAPKATSTTDSAVSDTADTPAWSVRRAFQALIRGRPPIVAILISFITSLAVATAAIAWALTYSAAERSSTTLAKALQDETLKRVLLNANTVYNAAETSAEVHVRNWERGFYSVATSADMERATQFMFSALYPNRYMFTAQAFYTTAGERNAGLWEINPAGQEVYLISRHRGTLYQTWIVDKDGDNVAATPRSNRTGMSFLYDSYYYVPGASFWEAYMMLSFKPVGMKSYIRTLVCSTGETILQSTDISLQRMVNDLKDSAAASPYRSFLFAIELGATPDKDIMMADSLDTNYMIYTDRAKGRARPLLLSETRTAYMTEPYFNATTYVEGHDLARDLYDYVASTAEGSVEKLNTQLGGETAVVKLRSVPYFLRVDLLLRPQTGVRQAIIMLVDRNHVMADLTQSNKKAIGIIAGVVAAGVGLAVAFSLMLANALYKITKDLKLLSKFKFTEVLRPLDKEGTVKKARFSRINELWQIQQAFHQMTVNFASAVSQNKRFGDATQAHRRTTLNGPVGASGVMSDSEV